MSIFQNVSSEIPICQAEHFASYINAWNDVGLFIL